MHILKYLLILIIILFPRGCGEKEGILLVRNGKTRHTILLASSAPESVRTAAADLRMYVEKVTGTSPGIVTSDEIPAGPFISLGSTSASADAGLDAAGIHNDGFRIVTRENNIFILGPDTPDGQVNSKGGVSRGTSNGVYTFIEEYLGVRWLMPGPLGEEYVKTRKLNIPQINRMEDPPFDYRMVMYRDRHPLEEEWDRRMKLGEVAAVETGHTWIETVPPSLYDEHPDWFALVDGKRVPPIGHYYKLETTNPELVEFFAGRILEIFRNDPNRRWYSLSPSDGGSGWSESAESMALTETDRWGNLSRTPLVLTFYNDVARIVGREFPDHTLGGLLYGNKGGYRAPPSGGLSMEPNLALKIPNGPAYGFRLYRDFAQENWADSIYISEWSELSRKYGFDIYYGDYPITLIPSDGIICPPAPGLLNFTFSRLEQYGFKGANLAGNPNWPVYGPGNFTLARLLWDPEGDAHTIQHDYYRLAYGEEAGSSIDKIYQLLDSAFSAYYARDHRIAWNLVEEHLEFIYAPNYREMEEYYLAALPARKNERQQQRLELFGQVLSILQWTLRDYGYLPPEYHSVLTLSDEEVDGLVAGQRDDCRITRRIHFSPGPVKVHPSGALAGKPGQKHPVVPVARTSTMLLYVPADGDVSLIVEKYNRRAEFIQYLLTDEKGTVLRTGAIREGRTLRFRGEAGKYYYLYIPSRKAFGAVRAEGAATAYHVPGDGIHLEGSLMTEQLPLYFYVPPGIPGFTLIMGGEGAGARLYDPEGREAGSMDNTGGLASHIQVPEKAVQEGFWKIVLRPAAKGYILTLDEQLPQWLLPDPAKPLMIFPQK